LPASLILIGLLLAGCHRPPPKVAVPAAKPPAAAPAPSLFQIGDNHFEAGKYHDAALAYEGYLRENPDGKDCDTALFRLALSYGLDQEAPEGYSKAQKQLILLVTQFPRSEYKPQAQYMLALQGDIERLKVDLRERQSQVPDRIEPPAEKAAPVEETDKAQRQKERALIRQKDKVIQDQEKEIQEQDELIRKLNEELERMKQIDLQRRPSRPPG
jgi:hypothetical protein